MISTKVSTISPDERRELADASAVFMDGAEKLGGLLKSIARLAEGRRDDEISNLARQAAEIAGEMHDTLDVCEERLLGTTIARQVQASAAPKLYLVVPGATMAT